ncbi:MAG: carbohydrate-binding protein, partial [Bacteroidota bacterium]|nr:carbohydrate-binding protein [Bacteroidota bacterium]
ILAECPANQSGTETTKLSDGNSALDGLHNGDWALYAGVEFGSEDYPKASKSIEFTASCITKGGTVEVWLDSINGGKKIATCKIKNTGSISTFKKFITPTVKTVGRHDVYLKFSGKGSDKLFLLKEFTFK